MKKIISLLLSLAMLLTITSGLNLTAYADVQTGKCGDNVTYSLDTSTGVLAISGTGDMMDYSLNSPFHYKSSVKTVIIENGVTSIGADAFYGCENLTSVTIPNSVTSIGTDAFDDCTSLTSVTIPNSVISIGGGAFSWCTSLTSVTIPNSVTSIGRSAFEDCTSLTSVTIPDSVTSIGYMVFYGCTSLINIIIPDSVTSIGNYAFGHCRSLINIIIPDSVTSIGDYAFYDCRSLKNITMPNSVTNIGNCPFSGCYFTSENFVNNSNVELNDSSKPVIVDFDNDGFCIKDNELVNMRPVYAIGKVTIPNSVTSIGDSAFEDCTSLTNVTIPDSVTSISDYAFSWCTSLTSVTIPDGVTDISKRAFSNCKSLTNVTIGNSVTSIDDDAFHYCENLASITISNSVTSIGKSAFGYCTSLKDVYYTGSQSEWNKINIGSNNQCLTNVTIHYNWIVETHLITNEDETSFTVYNSTAIIDSVNDVNLKLISVNMNIAENSSRFDKEKIVKKNDIKGKEIKFTKDDFRDYIIPAQVTSDFEYSNSDSHNIYMTKDRKDGKPYVSSVYVQQIDDNNEPKASYCDVQYSSITLIDNAKYNIAISAVTNGAKDVKYYLIQNDGNSKYKTEITNGVASKIDLASKVQAGKSLYAYVVCDGVASEPVPLMLKGKELSNSVKNILNSSTVNILGGQTGKFKLSNSVPIIGGTEASLDFIKCPVGVEITGNKVKISVGFDIFGYSDSTDKSGDTETKWLSFKDSCKGIQEAKKTQKMLIKSLKNLKRQMV